MSDFMKTQKKIEKAVVSGYQKIEDTVVSGYKKVEDSFVKAFLTPDETPPQQEAQSDNTQSSQGKGD